MANFCTHCGAALSEGAGICGNCGAQIGASTVTPATTPAKSGVLKVVALLLGCFAVVTLIGIGSCFYVGYRVKGKAEELATKIGAVKGEVSAVLPTRTAKMEPCPRVDPSESQAFRAAAASAVIPIRPGLTLVSVWTNPDKEAHDLEILTTVKAIDENSVTVSMATNAPEGSKWSRTGSRTLCIADLLKGRQYETVWGGESEQMLAVPETIAGTTMFTVSRAVFEELEAGRSAEVEYVEARQTPWSLTEYGITNDFKVRLARVEKDDVPYSVIVNGERKDLSAIHVKGRAGDRDVEAWVLDDPANPITLNFLTAESYITYLKVNFPVAEKKLEREIARSGCAAVYGIYFDFDSARLRPESEPALAEIAATLEHNPRWKLEIEGHTDNIGGEAYNLELSSRRAQAVKESLVRQFSISPERLTASGAGASRPKAPNDRAEGRALNRRVELCRQ